MGMALVCMLLYILRRDRHRRRPADLACTKLLRCMNRTALLWYMTPFDMCSRCAMAHEAVHDVAVLKCWRGA